MEKETACVHDGVGFEAGAVPFYRTALVGKFAPEARRGRVIESGQFEAERSASTARTNLQRHELSGALRYGG